MGKRGWFALMFLGGFMVVMAVSGDRLAEEEWPCDRLCPKIGAEPAGKWLCYSRSDHVYTDLRTGERDVCFAKGETPAPDWCPKFTTTTIILGEPTVESVETDDAGVTTIRFSGTATQTSDR